MTKSLSYQYLRGHQASLKKAQSSPAKPRILIVDDEEEIVALLKCGFEDDGWNVSVAPDGVQALELMADETFDVVVSDLHMPRMNGLELLSRLKTHDNSRATKVCLLSGALNHEDLKQATNLGVAHVVVKPFTISKVTSKVRETCLTDSKAKVKLSYDSNILCSVLNAAQEVCHFYLKEPIAFGKPYIKLDTASSSCLTAMIALSRDQALGSVAFSCDQRFLKELAQIMLGSGAQGMKPDMVRDMAGEICNQITGKIKLNLARNHYHIQIGLPQVILGKGHVIPHLINNPVVRIPMSCKGCELAIEFAMSGRLKPDQANPVRAEIARGMVMFD